MNISNKVIGKIAFVREGVPGRSSWQLRLLGFAVCLAMGPAVPAFAQNAPNIAGAYRGMMTQCLSSPRLKECIKGLTDISRLADDVDAKRLVWETAGRASDSALTAGLHREYDAARDTLNLRIVDFNQDMKRPPAVSN